MSFCNNYVVALDILTVGLSDLTADTLLLFDLIFAAVDGLFSVTQLLLMIVMCYPFSGHCPLNLSLL